MKLPIVDCDFQGTSCSSKTCKILDICANHLTASTEGSSRYYSGVTPHLKKIDGEISCTAERFNEHTGYLINTYTGHWYVLIDKHNEIDVTSDIVVIEDNSKNIIINDVSYCLDRSNKLVSKANEYLDRARSYRDRATKLLRGLENE